MVFEGVPPDHLDRRQLNGAAARRHQGFAILATAYQASLAVLVAQHRLIGIAPQATDLGTGQRGQLRTGQALGLDCQATGERITDLDVFRLWIPAFAQRQVARR
ncbi:hypothetical protein D3C73_1338030 [compost metagenome]